MKKLIISITVLTIILLMGAKESQAAIVNPNINSHVIFYIPHQDDEALTFGVSILNHIQAGHQVHVVLLTDGSASGVRAKIGLTIEEFVSARNREFNYSLAILGVKPGNITYENLPDGTLTVTQAETIIKKYESKYPSAKHKAFSYIDSHSDHRNSGQALKNLHSSGYVTDARYYVRSEDSPTGLSLIKEGYQPYYKNLLLAVSTAYGINNPLLGFYSIGHRSVPQSFTNFETLPLSRYHK